MGWFSPFDAHKKLKKKATHPFDNPFFSSGGGGNGDGAPQYGLSAMPAELRAMEGSGVMDAQPQPYSQPTQKPETGLMGAWNGTQPAQGFPGGALDQVQGAPIQALPAPAPAPVATPGALGQLIGEPDEEKRRRLAAQAQMFGMGQTASIQGFAVPQQQPYYPEQFGNAGGGGA